MASGKVVTREYLIGCKSECEPLDFQAGRLKYVASYKIYTPIKPNETVLHNLLKY